MSAHLFTYRDLLRIHRNMTPSRAPGPEWREVFEITLLITDLFADLMEAMLLATKPFETTLISDFLLAVLSVSLRIAARVGINLLDLLTNLLKREGLSVR